MSSPVSSGATIFQNKFEDMQQRSDAAAILQMDSFSREFFSRLPPMVRNDVRAKVTKRMNRANPTRDNLLRAARDSVNQGLKLSRFIEDRYSFVDCRNQSHAERLSHNILMRDDAVTKLSEEIANETYEELAKVYEGDEHFTYLSALYSIYQAQSEILNSVHIEPPVVMVKTGDQWEIENSERLLEIAIQKMQYAPWIEKRFLRLRTEYLEFCQITLERVGKKAHQQKYVSEVSFANWMTKQHDAKRFTESMSVLNTETGEHFKLEDVVKRTIANPENRRIEMMVRSRGFEELADEKGYTGLFVTWTLPSKYHRRSSEWRGASVKEGHKRLMKQWARARAAIAKDGIDYFGFRVAEPHKDGTSHAHYFLFCHPSDKKTLLRRMRRYAIAEDKSELKGWVEDKKTDELRPKLTVRFDYTEADPKQGGATAYISKYVSKNINGAHMPEGEGEKEAYLARAWSSTHRIRQFQQFGGEPVSLWRQLRRADPEQTAIDEQLEELRQAADSSKWKRFCELAGWAKIAYEEKKNQFGEVVKKVIGFNWLKICSYPSMEPKLIETAGDQYQLVKTKDIQRVLGDGGTVPWSTENKCNQLPEKPVSPLEKALMDVTGWSVKGVQCLIPPLMKGAKVAIDRYTNIRLTNGRLSVN